MNAHNDGFLTRQNCVRLAISIACAAVAFSSDRLQAQFKYTPESPEVQAMVERGVAYIEPQLAGSIGPISLSAIAICEAGKRYHGKIPVDHLLVQRALVNADRFTLTGQGTPTDTNTVYEVCVATILLALVDPVKYEPNIRSVLTWIENRQMESGAWKYNVEGTPKTLGDTSQTQYCCLAIWMAANVGYPVNKGMVEQALDWLSKTQTVDGGWQYRNTATSERSAGGGETLSMTAAGAGGMLMLLNALDAKNVFGPKGAKRAGTDLPPFITEYSPDQVEENEERQTSGANIDVAAIKSNLADANQYFGRNFRTNPPEWAFYYLYGFERYAYFREQGDGEVREVPDWYDQGVEFLKSTQQPDGSWRSSALGEQQFVPQLTTAFAILFLVRSTELLANDPGKTVMHGGDSLPKGKTKLIGTKIYGEETVRNVDDFFAALSQDPDNIEDFADSLTTLVFPTDPAKRELYMGRLRVLITDADAYKRLVAVKALATARDLNNVPVLILAMQDDENEIKLAAHRGLRFISRKIDSIELPAQPDEGDFLTARRQWIDWYNSIRPEAQLEVE